MGTCLPDTIFYMNLSEFIIPLNVPHHLYQVARTSSFTSSDLSFLSTVRHAHTCTHTLVQTLQKGMLLGNEIGRIHKGKMIYILLHLCKPHAPQWVSQTYASPRRESGWGGPCQKGQELIHATTPSTIHSFPTLFLFLPCPVLPPPASP